MTEMIERSRETPEQIIAYALCEARTNTIEERVELMQVIIGALAAAGYRIIHESEERMQDVASKRAGSAKPAPTPPIRYPKIFGVF